MFYQDCLLSDTCMWHLKVKTKPSYNHVSLLALLALSEQFLSSNQVFSKEKLLTILEKPVSVNILLSIYNIYISKPTL